MLGFGRCRFRSARIRNVEVPRITVPWQHLRCARSGVELRSRYGTLWRRIRYPSRQLSGGFDESHRSDTAAPVPSWRRGSPARPSTVSRPCVASQRDVQRNGAIVLGTGGYTYDRFVADRRFCQFDEFLDPAWSAEPGCRSLLRRLSLQDAVALEFRLIVLP